jgi:nucleoid-associated protein YejK
MWLDIMKMIFEFISKSDDMKAEKKLRISEVFQDISDLLEETVDDLRNDIYPHGKCMSMANLAENMTDLMKDYVEKDKLEKLTFMLKDACRLEKEFATRSNPGSILEIQTTAGMFNSFAIMYKII